MEIKDQIKLDLIRDAFANYIVCLRIVRSNSEITSKIIFQYLPFLSLNLLDIIDKFDLFEIADEYYPQSRYDFTKLLHSNRALLKQDTINKKYSQNRKEILQLINKNYYFLTKDYNIIQKIRIKIKGQKDFAVYSYKGIPFFNNIQNSRFNELFLGDDYVIKGEDLTQFSYSVVNFLQVFVSQFVDSEKFKAGYEEKIQYELNIFDMNDYFVYEKARSDLFTNDLEIDQNVFLFNLLCLGNSSIYLYPDVLKLEGHPQLRMKFITYLIVIKGLWIYQNDFHNLSEDLKSLIKVSDSIFKSEKNRGEFRNNLFHFDLPNGAKYEVNIINSLVKHYLNTNLEKFNSIVSESLDVFVIEANKILFGEQRKFLGTNC